MAERIEAAGPDGSTFTKPEGLLAHYTDASAAFEHILPTGKLRMSPYRLMRDPVENKDILPSIAWRGDPPDAGRAIDEVYAQLKAARDRMRVLSFTHDADRRAEYAGFDCCWSRPRMWEQYGDKHRGVCLLFDAPPLKRAITDQSPPEHTYMRDVDYTREGIAAAYGPVRTMIDERIFEGRERAKAVAEYVEERHEAFFFLKAMTSRRSTSIGRCWRLAMTSTSASSTGTRWSASCSASVSH